MRLWNYLLILSMALCLLIPVVGIAADEDPVAPEDEAPSFQNPAQAQHAANVAEASFSEQDEARVENYAEDVAEKTATETATTRAELAANTYATEEAEASVVKTAETYASGINSDPDSAEYQRAYNYAYERATNPDYSNAYDAAYEKAYDASYDRYYDAAYKQAYDSAYDEAYGYGVSRITGAKVEDIERLREEEGMGWGEIAKAYGVHPSVLGLGKKGVVTMDDEIEAVTRRNTRTGWDDGTGFNTQRNKNNNGSRELGLTEASSAALTEVKGNNAGGKGKSSDSSESNSSSSKSKDKGSNSSGKSDNGGNGNSKGSDNGNGNGNGNKGGNGGNKGGNGKNK